MNKAGYHIFAEGNNMLENHAVEMKRESLMIPTYKVCKADKNPIFFETRNIQGTKGNVYPIPYTDRITDEKIEKKYDVVRLENKYIQLLVLPEMGGRIYAALDKTNEYNFIYRNNVIKPALIGLGGPWISGGIEFNWPQHHRPTTFLPVDSVLEENEDGSRTVWVGEIEPLFHTKGMVGITLHPDKSYIQAKLIFYNRTPYVQTFHSWANLAVHVNDNYKALFPPDIDYVTYHAKKDVTTFPNVKGMFAGVDYGDGTDISWYKNVMFPQSFFIFNSNYDFMGGYDYSKNAGVVHIAERHISVGKKIFNWGCSDFGKRWCKNLTDNDGPYLEIMTGCYTDNQPDFAWLQPFETKTVDQYWYPLREIGTVKNANINAAISVEVDSKKVKLAVNTTSERKNACIVLKAKDSIIFEKTVTVSPAEPFKADVDLEGYTEEELYTALYTSEGSEIVSYRKQPMYFDDKDIPQVHREPFLPKDIKNNEELYINGLHVEQYKHPTYDPEDYYKEALERDPSDSRCNNVMGVRYLKRGLFDKAEESFRKAIKALIKRNPNPYDGEPYYYLGCVLKLKERYEESCDALLKSAWNYSWQAPGYYVAAEIMCIKGDLNKALDYLDRALCVNIHNLKARNLKTAALRKLGRLEEAIRLCNDTIKMDRLDYCSKFEKYMLLGIKDDSFESEKVFNEVKLLLRRLPESYIDIAIDYGNAGLYDESLIILSAAIEEAADKNLVYPMIYYYVGYYSYKNGNKEDSLMYCQLAAAMNSDYCFPNRLESIKVLQHAIDINAKDAKALYYLGNLFYDKRCYDEAITCWEESRRIDGSFSIVHRNLGIAYFDKKNITNEAKISMEKAFELDKSDSRYLYELTQLYKNINVGIETRLKIFEEYFELVKERDDMYLENIKLYIQKGDYDTAIKMLKTRHFHPYEGGEGVLPAQHVLVYLMRGRKILQSGNVSDALENFKAALEYPDNYGEGKRFDVREAIVFYHIGTAYEKLGEVEQAKYWFEKASRENGVLCDADYFKGLALKKLGRNDEAEDLFRELLKYAEEELRVGGHFEYIDTSPTLLPFENDLDKNGKVKNGYLLGLGYLGLGAKKEAIQEFKKVLELDINQVWPGIFLEEL